MLWDLNEGKHLYSLEAGDIVNALVFSPNRYWLCAATSSCVKIFDLESKYVAHFPLNKSAHRCKMIGRSWTSLNPTLLMSVSTRVNLSACLSPGLQMDRLSLAASPTNWCVFGRCQRERHVCGAVRQYDQSCYTSCLYFMQTQNGPFRLPGLLYISISRAG